MLTWALRIVLVLILAVAATLGHLAKMLWSFDFGLVVLVISLVGLQTAMPLGALALSARDFSTQESPARRWLASAAETFAFWRIFVMLMPFERFWMGEEKPLPFAPDRTPILLVPGYCCNRAMWFDLARALSAAGRSVATVTLEPPFADIDRLAEQLESRIARVLAETGAPKLLLVGHSMGGLIARACLARRGGAGIASLITLATPHHGSRLARLALGRNARQMQPESEWLAALNARAAPVPIHAFWAGRDEFVSPPDSARLPGADETCAPLCGHYSLLQAREIFDALLSASQGPVAEAARAESA